MELTPFDFSGKTVRIIMDENTDPWWVASDICIVLGLSNPTEALKALDGDEKSTLRVSEGGPERNIINEPGLYRLLARSNKKRAKKFQRWVFHDVLPKIRKTGNYSAVPKLPKTYVEALEELLVKAKENVRLLAENTELKPKAKVYDSISSSTGLVCISDAAKILAVHPHTFSASLVKDNFCFRRRGKIIPYVQYENRGWFQVKLVPASDRTGHTYRQTFITPLGVSKFREIYNPNQKQRRLFA